MWKILRPELLRQGDFQDQGTAAYPPNLGSIISVSVIGICFYHYNKIIIKSGLSRVSTRYWNAGPTSWLGVCDSWGVGSLGRMTLSIHALTLIIKEQSHQATGSQSGALACGIDI